MAAQSLLGRVIRHLHLHLHRHTTLPAAVCSIVRRSYCTTTATESPPPIRKTTYDEQASLRPPKWKHHSDYRKWKDTEAEIFRDIDPITLLIKDILHSDRYMDRQQLTSDYEKMVVEKILAYHPHSEDKIGCGLNYIMVDRHPQFRYTRCLFVVRTDGVWIDFSYRKCIRAYIRQKYPSYAETFIKKHYKCSSS